MKRQSPTVKSPNVLPNVLVGRRIRNVLYLPTEVLMERSKPVHLNALLDSGAASSFIHQDIVKQHGFKQKLLNRPVVVGNVDGSDNQGGWIRKYMILPILCGGKKKSYERFLVGNIGHEFMILGYDWIRKHNPGIDWERNTLLINKAKVEEAETEAASLLQFEQ